MEAVSIPENKFAVAVHNVIIAIGRYCSSLNVILIAAIIIQVVLRYVFGMGLVQLEELQWHLYAVNVVFGFAYCNSVNSHIRLDLVYDRLSQRSRAKIEIFGILFLLLPLIYVIFIHSLDFLWEAIRTNEGSDSPVGLCCRWIPKALIPFAMVMTFASAIARLVQAFHYLKAIRKGGTA
jgi:TRAP-type mannitol/chloroaromatic compound transport system permease small subunit